MEIENSLRNIGLSPNEVSVYLVLNDHGSNKAGKIAKLSEIDRSSCYQTLQKLIQRGLVSYVTIGKVRWFQITGPKRLLDYLKEQERDIRQILPELEKRHKARKVQGQVRMFRGLKGVKSIFLDIVRSKKSNYVLGSEGQFGERMKEFLLQFERLKKENNIRTRLLLRKARGKHDSPKTEYRLLEGIAKSSAVTNIYGNKIAIIIWTTEPEGIIIENEIAAKAYRSYFNFMWQKAKIQKQS